MKMTAIQQDSEIKEFYRDTSIFITGGTGFVGKLIIEKLLRSCPGIRKFYILCRQKEEKEINKRVDELFDDVLFDKVRETDPQFKSKIVPIQGDCAQNNLGISGKDLETLVNEVNIIFHCAAIVRFDEAICTIVRTNIRCTHDVLLLAHKMKQLKAFVHVSSAYSNCVHHHIKEKMYDLPSDAISGDQLMQLVESTDEDTLIKITPGLLGEYPNMYLYSKAVAENMVKQNSRGLPVCFVRPSIILSTYKQPIAGWCGNFYRPIGGVANTLLGIFCTSHCAASQIAALAPADYMVNACIVATWDVAQMSDKQRQKGITDFDLLGSIHDTTVYNYTGHVEHARTRGEYMKEVFKWSNILPALKCLFTIITNYKSIAFLFRCLFHFLPAYILDGLLFCVGKKPRYIKHYAFIYKYIGVMLYFLSHEWKFDTGNLVNLYAKLNNIDKEQFNFDMSNIDWSQYYKSYVTGIRVYVLRDPLTTLPQARRKQMMYNGINIIILVLALCYIGFILYKIL